MGHRSALMLLMSLFVFSSISAIAAPAGHPSTVLSGQDHRISVQGVIRDSEGEVLAGVTIFVQGTSNVSVTNREGWYTIDNVSPDATLVINMLGYLEQSVPVNGRTSIDITMSEDVQALDEAIAIGYGSQKKVTLTGSVTTTTGDALVKNSSINLSQGLAGRLSGVIVNNRSGEPGKDDAVMFIRGRSTLGNNNPLIIIDGVPGRDEEFSRLTGDEIESVTVLKDASASIYGSRSANGVILVTTKRGILNTAPDITFSYDLGLQQPTRLVRMADAVLYTTAYNDALAITGAAPYYNDTQVEHYRAGDDPILYPNTNWFDEIIKPISAQHKYGVSINGGAERIAYFVQLNGQFQDGIYEKSATNYNQVNLRTNLDIKVTQNLTLGFDIQARQQHKNYSAFPSDSYGIFYITTRMKPTGGAYYPNGLLRGGTNPAVLVQDLTGYDRTTINSINTTFSVSWNLSRITKGLSVSGKLAYDIISRFRKNWQKQWQYWSYDEITGEYEEHTTSYWSTPTLHEYQTHYKTTTVNANINYDHDFDGHHVTALAGFEQSSHRRDYFTAGRDQYTSSILDELFAGSADKNYFTANGNASETAKRSFFGRIGYDYKSKYLIQAIARYDGSENFPKNKRWGFFPSISAGWRMSEELFIKDNLPWITNLKVRVSYGEQGNDQIDSFQYLTNYEYTSRNSYKMKFDDKEVNFIIPGTIPNPNVTWEVAKTWNIGMDGSIRNGLFTWEAEWFRTKRENILCTRNASIPYYTGMTSNLPDENIGIVRNTGVEFQAGHENRTGNLMYHITANFLYAKNKIGFMDETPWPEGHEYMKLEGKPMGASLYYQTIGINKTQEDLDNNPQMSGATLGDFIYADLDNDGKITNLDRKRVNMTSVPEIVFGINFDARWKEWDFSLLIQGQTRAKYYYSPLMDPVSGNIERQAAERAWTLSNKESDYPRLGSTVSNGGVNRSSFYLRDASFMRLKNLEIGYSIPKTILSGNLGVKGIRLYLGGYNLLTFSGLKNVDPETSDESYQTYPQMRIFNTGVKITF